MLSYAVSVRIIRSAEQRGFLMSYVLTALAFIAIATAMYANLQSSQGDFELRERELDQMVRVVTLLHSGLKACGSCGNNTSQENYVVNAGTARGFVPGIRTSMGVAADVGGSVASMACPNIKDAADQGRYVWNNLGTGSPASRSVLGVAPPQLRMFSINYELVASAGIGRASEAKFTFAANGNAMNPKDLYERFVFRASGQRMTTVDLVFDGGYNTASRTFVMKTSPNYSTFHIQCQ